MGLNVNLVRITVVNTIVVRVRLIIPLVVGRRSLSIVGGLPCFNFAYQQ